jgi:DNA-binding protein YbaB
MFGDMMNKIQEAKKKVEQTKSDLDNKQIEVEKNDVKVVITGNGAVKDVQLPANFQQLEKEEIEDLISLAVSEAVSKSIDLKESSLKDAAQGMLPNIPGMDNLF